MKEKVKKYDLLVIIIVLEFFEIVQQHKMYHNLMKYEIVYNVHAVMHVQQLNLVLIEGNINYDLKVLKENESVQLLHILTTQFWFDLLVLEKEKEKDKQQ